MNHTHTETKEKTKPEVAPCPPQAPGPVDTCCELVCFERPRYFCGHLLTDTDLTKEQKYVIEKHKLYNRSLHGHGVVCGLRLTCNHHCPGEIIIGDGYAIDNCGNDLVVCEPERFDVIRALKEKGYLIEEPPADPCKPHEKPPECKIKQCFYIVACYKEEATDFTTPFVKGCRPTITECEATRVMETVWFDVVDKLPIEVDPLDDLKARIEKCWKLFTDSRFSDALLKHKGLIAKIVSAKDDVQAHDDCFTVFCELRRLLLLYLEKYPDHYNCTTEQEIRKIPEPKAESGHYIQECREAICRLLELAYQYVISCVWGELVVSCPEPAKASCVVLGTVEVESGSLIRVCNCPRRYVWSFANFGQVSMATILGDSACTTLPEQQADHTCCNQCQLDCKQFFGLFARNRSSLPELSTVLLKNIPELVRSLKEIFDPCREDVIPAGDFRGSAEDEARNRGEELNVQIAGSIDLEREPRRRVPIIDRLSGIEPIVKGSAEHKGSTLNLLLRAGKVVDVQPVTPRPEAALPIEEKRQLDEKVRVATTAADAAIARLNDLAAHIDKVRQEIEEEFKTRAEKLGGEFDEKVGAHVNRVRKEFDEKLAVLEQRIPPVGGGGGPARRRRTGGGENP